VLGINPDKLGDGILVNVLVEPDIVLLVNVSVVVLATIVSVMVGNVNVMLPVWLTTNDAVVPVVAPVKLIPNLFDGSVGAIICVIPTVPKTCDVI
jgi:hypothetical protein